MAVRTLVSFDAHPDVEVPLTAGTSLNATPHKSPMRRSRAERGDRANDRAVTQYIMTTPATRGDS